MDEVSRFEIDISEAKGDYPSYRDVLDDVEDIVPVQWSGLMARLPIPEDKETSEALNKALKRLEPYFEFQLVGRFVPRQKKNESKSRFIKHI